MPQLRAFLTFGTRPEAIKMAPVVRECRLRDDAVETTVCVTGQHREMLDQVTRHFGLEVDCDLAVMRPNQTLPQLTARCLERLDEALARFQPDCVVAQGDTTTAMAAAMAAFYRRIPFVHVEAGLRTGDLLAPWPEEFNRRVASLVTTLHCAPTPRAAANLRAEGISDDAVKVTGNTVVDALMWTVERERGDNARWLERYAMLADRRLVLITGHRRENFGEGMRNVCRAIAKLSERFGDVEFVYPVHLNPNVRGPVYEILSGRSNVHLTEPATYPEFVWLMDRAALILTDSGGVQEEAPSLRKPVLVMRETTERPEAVESGAVELVGTDAEKIVASASALLSDKALYVSRQVDENPYGDGHAGKRIVEWMIDRLSKEDAASFGDRTLRVLRRAG